MLILGLVLQDAEEYTQLPVRHNEDLINRYKSGKQKPMYYLNSVSFLDSLSHSKLMRCYL